MTVPAPAPVSLPPNIVWRSYLGGRELRRFRGLPAAPDNHFPEDWLASTIRARNGANSQGPAEGLSRVTRAGSEVLLADWMREDPAHWFGSGANADSANPGVLWKLLDSGVRLQFQAHPDAAFARKRLNSHAGKTECWYIVGTRGDACVYLGFQNPPSRDEWGRLIREQNIPAMQACFEKIPVQAGDCFVVPARTPHAIGEGVLMVELMEPTDWAIRCETVNGGVTLTPEQCFMGIGLEECLDVFDYRRYSLDDVRQSFWQSPVVVNRPESDNYLDEKIIADQWRNFFRLHRLRGDQDASWTGNEFMVALLLNGRGVLACEENRQELAPGQTCLLPGSASRWHWENRDNSWEMLLLKCPITSI